MAAEEPQAAGTARGDWLGFDRFSAVQDVLDRNAILIQQIDANHRTRTPEALQRNVVLVRELNTNVQRVVELYGELADVVLGSGDAAKVNASKEGSAGNGGGQQQQQ